MDNYCILLSDDTAIYVLADNVEQLNENTIMYFALDGHAKMFFGDLTIISITVL